MTPHGDDADDRAEIRAEVERIDKAIATLRARAALAGFELHVGGPPGRAEFWLTRWGWSSSFADVAAVAAALDRAGAK